MNQFMTFFNEENELFYSICQGDKKHLHSNRTRGITDEVEIIGNGTLVLWSVALEHKGQYIRAARLMVNTVEFLN